MNPYNAPKADLTAPRGPLPGKIIIVLLLIVISAPSAILGTYMHSLTEGGLGLTDPFNLGINAFWLCVLLWFANRIIRERENPKTAFLILAMLMFGFAVNDHESTYVLVTELVEALCFASCYFILRAKSLVPWFQQ